jgi:hypothetical protein
VYAAIGNIPAATAELPLLIPYREKFWRYPKLQRKNIFRGNKLMNELVPKPGWF